MIPDIINTLSTRDEVDSKLFKSFAYHILGYIEKDKQANILTDKMILRLKNDKESNFKERLFGTIFLFFLSNELRSLDLSGYSLQREPQYLLEDIQLNRFDQAKLYFWDGPKMLH